VCFSCGFLPRFWHSLHISSHPMIFIVSSVILLSFCAFRILEYLLIGIFSWNIVHENLYVCVLGWSWYIYAWWVAALLIFLFGIHLTAVLNTALFLELTGSNGIFGDISSWFWFRNMTSSGSQHNVWQMDPLENWLLLSDVQNSKGLRIKDELFLFFWATCILFSIFLLFWILESFCLWILLLCLPLYFWDIEGE